MTKKFIDEIEELQERLDNTDVDMLVTMQPREPEAIMKEARQLNDRLNELKFELSAWQALQPKETAH